MPDRPVATIPGVPGVATAHGDVTVSPTTVVDAAITAIDPTSGAPLWVPETAHTARDLPVRPRQVVGMIS